MEAQRVDGIARRPGTVTDRRTGLKGLAAALGGLAVGGALRGSEPTAAKKKKPKGLAGAYVDYGDGVPYLNHPNGIAWRNTSDPLIVAEGVANLVTLVDPLGASPGVAGGFPTGVAFVGSDIYVTDTNLQLVYTRNGSDNTIKNPDLISTGTNGNVWIASSGSGFYLSRGANAGLSKHQADGTQDWSVTTCSQPRGVAVGPGGHVYVACAETGGLQAHDASTGALLFSVASSTGPGATPKKTITRPVAIAFDGDRGYVSTAASGKKVAGVYALTIDLVTSTFTNPVALKPFAKEEGLTSGLAVDTSGNVYMSKGELGTVVKWTPAD